MKKIDQDKNKKQRLKIFKFDLNNIKNFTIDHFLNILENNGFSLRFSVSEQEFLKHLKSIGFKKTKDPMFDLEFEQEEVFIKLTYSILGQPEGSVYIKKILTCDKNLDFNPDGNLGIKHYNKDITTDLFEQSSIFYYEFMINNNIKNEFISSIHYFYEDDRIPRIEDYKLYSIIENPIEFEEFGISLFDVIYVNNSNEKRITLSDLALHFENKNLIFSNQSSEYRYSLIDFEQIFSKQQIDLLRIIQF